MPTIKGLIDQISSSLIAEKSQLLIPAKYLWFIAKIPSIFFNVLMLCGLCFPC